MKDQLKDPKEYGYSGDEVISMTARDFLAIKQVLNNSLQRETKVLFPEKYKYVNRENGEDIKKVTDKNKHLAMKIVDVDATRMSTPHISRTPEGMDLLEAELIMTRIHVNMVDSGVAKHQSTFSKNVPVGEGVFAQKEESPLGETKESTEE